MIGLLQHDAVKLKLLYERWTVPFSSLNVKLPSFQSVIDDEYVPIWITLSTSVHAWHSVTQKTIKISMFIIFFAKNKSTSTKIKKWINFLSSKVNRSVLKNNFSLTWLFCVVSKRDWWLELSVFLHVDFFLLSFQSVRQHFSSHSYS